MSDLPQPEPSVPANNFDTRAQQVVYFFRPPKRRYWLHALLFVCTAFTTTMVGARLQWNFAHNLPLFPLEQALFPISWILRDPNRLLLGLPFSAALLFILLAHEMGHFICCVRYRVYATLPFFLPAPTLIGTLGAFIQVKSPFHSRRALFDIGIAGPIAGFLVALPILIYGLKHSQAALPAPDTEQLVIGYPLIFTVLRQLISISGVGRLPADWNAVSLHPVAMAAWVGMFATSLNLLPGGQLDGGHIIYALSARAHRIVSRLTVLALLPLGWLWGGWLVWAAILLFFGTRHPRVPLEPSLGNRRILLSAGALVMLVLTFTPAPFTTGFLRWQ